MTKTRDPDRQPAAYITKSHGAYLIHFTGELAGDSATNDQFSAASSIAVAKRVAVDGARSFGFVGAVRWTQQPFGWVLEMTYAPEPEGEVSY